MRPRQKPTVTEPRDLVWDRPVPAKRPAPGPLTRERIVRAAVALADKRGLEGVSLRKVAAKLNVGPMRIYGYTSTKEGLLELMVDAVYGEIAEPPPIRLEWRDALRSVARRTREAAKSHTWFVDLLGGRVHLGPNALAHLEGSLAGLARNRGFADIDTALQALRIVNAYVVGAIRGEATELRAELQTGMNESAWQEATWPYLERVIATGRFPMIAKVVTEARHPSPDAAFETGLEWVIDGIAAALVKHERGKPQEARSRSRSKGRRRGVEGAAPTSK
jgi:AcrR family transcriptional regulator